MKRWEKYRKEMYGNERLTLKDIIYDILVRCMGEKFGTNCERCPLKNLELCIGVDFGPDNTIKYLEEVYHEER